MQDPERFHVLFDSNGEIRGYTPYSATAEREAKEKGLLVKTFSKGDKSYSTCLEAWHKHEAGETTPRATVPASNLSHDRNSPAGSSEQLSPEAAKDPKAAARREWDASPALQAEFLGNFDAYWSYVDGVQRGLVLIIRDRTVKEHHP